MSSPVRCKALPFPIPPEAAAVLDAAPSVTVATDSAQLVELAVSNAVDGWHEVAYDVPDKGRVVEARVCRAKKGMSSTLPRLASVPSSRAGTSSGATGP